LGSFKFKIILGTPLKLPRERLYRDENGHIFIPATLLKGSIRKSFETLTEADKAQPDLTEELFGTLTDNVTKAASFSVSSALSENSIETDLKKSIQIQRETGSAKIGVLYDEEFVPKGTVFNGTIHSEIPENTAEDMALRLALLSVRNVGVGTAQGWGACTVEISDGATETEILYDFDSFQKPSISLESTRIWIPSLEDELFRYFARHPEEIRKMPARSFEKLVAALFKREGFEVVLTPETRDGGYDILAVRHDRYTGNETFLVECKRYAEHRRVGIDVIRNLMGVIQLENATKGIITTTTTFSSEAKRKAEAVSTRLVLQDYDFIKQWIHDVSVI
jgi:restriction system protein